MWVGVAAFFPAIGVIFGLAIGDSALVGLFAELVGHVILGLGGSYLLHETAHLVLLSKYPSVQGIDVKASWSRFSVHPHGTLSAHQTITVGASGPVACGLIGIVLWMLDSTLALWYIGHLIFLLPIFGDGKAVLLALSRTRASS